MGISTEEKEHYLKETAIVLAREGFQTLRTQTGRLRVLLDDTPLCELAESGVTYRNEDVNDPERIDAKDKVYGIVRTTAEYMRQMETAPFLKASGLEDGYRVLADFNDTVLAGHPTDHGVQFVTWDWDYKDFSDAHIDTIEIMVSKLYAKWGITERSNFRRMRPEDYPILSDLYDLIEEEFKSYDPNAHLLYTEKLLQEVLLGLHSMCKGADAQFFNGHTNITSSRFLVFGVKGMLSAAKNLRNTMLFNVLSFMSDKLLTEGNTVAALDELYIWLSNPTAIEYIRNCLKRVRKKESAMLLASQNLEDFDQEGIREMTKPLFSIPPHQFLFNAGSIDKRSYIESAATSREEIGNPIYPSARRKLAEHGISCAGHAARQLTNRDYDEYDLLIGMDQANLRDMYRICGGDYAGKMSLLMDHTARPGNVADPWYTGDFEATWQDVLEGCQGLLKEFKTE